MSNVNYKIAITSLLNEEPLGHFIVVDGENKPYYIGLSDSSVSPDVSPSVSTIRVKCYHRSNNESAGYVTLPGIVYDASNSNFINDINTFLSIVDFAVDESEPITVVDSSDFENINLESFSPENVDLVYVGYNVLLTAAYVGTNDVRQYFFQGLLNSVLSNIKDSIITLNVSLLAQSAGTLPSTFVSDNGNHLWAIIDACIINVSSENVNIVW